MRHDSVGFFWDDTPPPKESKSKASVKRQPPIPVWLNSDYLPGLDEAIAYPVRRLTLQEHIKAVLAGEEMITDVESYPNYFHVTFTSLKTGAVYYIEKFTGEVHPEVEGDYNALSANEPLNPEDQQHLRFVLEHTTTTGFNSLNYDMTVLNLAASGVSVHGLYLATNEIIADGARPSDVLRRAKVKRIKADHVDLIEVAPLFASLKTYAGRMHCPKMQDLPVKPGTWLTYNQMLIVRWYCVNDTWNTAYLREHLREQIDLRVELSNEYRVDLRSKSDAQIAEAVIGGELKKLTGKWPSKPTIEVGTAYKYDVPDYMQFKTPLMQRVLQIVKDSDFVVEETGSIANPPEIAGLKIDINGTVYTMGIGGLHSTEKKAMHVTDEDYILIDKDVTSYYPMIILNQGLYPDHLGQFFLKVYRSIVERRIAAKMAGNKPVSNSLKIVVNGSYGKLGSKWSILYSPRLLTQVTMTGQLSLLLLVEMLELAGMHVVSANTDGIVTKVPRSRVDEFNAIVRKWEAATRFETEEARYMALYSKDVNNYIAVKQKEGKDSSGKQIWIEEAAGTKTKGTFANPWSNTKDPSLKLHKNPQTTICIKAMEDFLIKGIPVEQTILNSRDIREFLTVRSVTGGAVKVWDFIPPEYDPANVEPLLKQAGYVQFAEDSWTREECDTLGRGAVTTDRALETAVGLLSQPGKTDYLGKSVRWYYGVGEKGDLLYAKSGNKVPKSDGAVPVMVLPDTFPENVDYEWYIAETKKLLSWVGFGDTNDNEEEDAERDVA